MTKVSVTLRLLFIIFLLSISSGMWAKDVEVPKGNFSEVLVRCESLARRRTIYIPEEAVVQCVKLLKQSENLASAQKRRLRKMLISILKKIFIKSEAIEHLDSNLSLSLKEIVATICKSDQALLKLALKDPYLKWVGDN